MAPVLDFLVPPRETVQPRNCSHDSRGEPTGTRATRNRRGDVLPRSRNDSRREPGECQRTAIGLRRDRRPRHYDPSRAAPGGGRMRGQGHRPQLLQRPGSARSVRRQREGASTGATEDGLDRSALGQGTLHARSQRSVRGLRSVLRRPRRSPCRIATNRRARPGFCRAARSGRGRAGRSQKLRSTRTTSSPATGDVS